MFDQITIIGCGLIGSSLARAINHNKLAKKLIMADADPNVCAKAKEIGLSQHVTNNIIESVINSDIVILATPVGTFGQIAEDIGPVMKAGSILSDVGSVKQCVIDATAKFLPESVELVPAHPIAGTEHSGPESGFRELFIDRWCILTPPDTADLRAVEKISALWDACGMRIEIMDAKHHDLILGITSHLPHLIAYTIVGTAADLEDDIKSEVIKFSASGFRGFTRVAASDPVMWRDVFLNNKDAVLDILQRFTEDLTALQKSIRRGDGSYMEEVFSRGRAIRRDIMTLGPEGLPSPNQEKIEQ
jgi:cyclohexadieny/prephenate dehydrogenase